MVLFRYLGRTFVMYSNPEGNNANFTGKIARGQTKSMNLIDFGNRQNALYTGVCENESHIPSQCPESPQNVILVTVGKYGVSQVRDIG